MDYQTINTYLNSPGFHIFQASQSPLILAFLYREFIEAAESSIDADKLKYRLTRDIEEHDLSLQAGPLLSLWEKQGFIKFIVNPNRTSLDETEFLVTLTPSTKLALGYVEQVINPSAPSVATSINTLYEHTADLVSRNSSDTTLRKQFLQDRIDSYTTELTELDTAKRPTPYAPVLVRSKKQEIRQLCSTILNDLALIQTALKQMYQNTRSTYLHRGVKRDQIIHNHIDHFDAMMATDPGLSYQALRIFLSNEQRYSNLIRWLLQLSLTSPTNPQDTDIILNQFAKQLHQALQTLSSEAERISDNLKLLFDERIETNHRQFAALSKELFNLVLQIQDAQIPIESLAQNETLNDLFHVEHSINFIEPFLRPPWLDRETDYEDPILEEASTELTLDIAQALAQSTCPQPIDIERHIDTLLSQKSEVTLVEAISERPITHGLEELMIYLNIAEQSDSHLIDDNIRDQIPTCWQDRDREIYEEWNFPHIVFRRAPNDNEYKQEG